MSFAAAWDETKPAGGDDANQGDDRIREFKTQVRERMGVDHYFPATDGANTGYHSLVTLLKQTSDPAQLADAIRLYSKTVGSYQELYSRHENAALQQLTLNGKLWVSALAIASAAAGDILYYDGSIFTRLAKDVGKFLKSGASAPAWDVTPIESVASQADQETGTSLVAAVTPGTQKYHPSAVKAWCMFNGTTAGTFSPSAGFNVASVTRNAAGDYTVTFTNAMSSANYCVTGTAREGATGDRLGVCLSPTTPLAAGACRVQVYYIDNILRDSSVVCVMVCGDQ